LNLKSLESILEGVGKLRAASVVAAAVSTAALLGLNIPANVQSAGLIAVAVLIAAVNVADGFIRGKHAAALPALIEQGAESVTKNVQDPRVDAVASLVNEIAAKVQVLEARPAAPTAADVIAGLTARPADPTPAPTPPAA
jgi:hypothetical protein